MSYWQEFSHLEDVTGWSRQAGPDIGGVVPSDYGFIQNISHPSLDGSAMELHVTGSPYADWLTALSLPVDKRTSQAQLDFWILVDEESLSVAQAVEFDLRISLGGENYNFSMQVDYENGMLQVTDKGAAWVNTSHLIGKIAPNWWHHVVVSVSYDFTNHIGRYLSLKLDESEYPLDLPAPVELLGWDDVIRVQFQQDTTQTGGTYRQWLDQVTVRVG